MIFAAAPSSDESKSAGNWTETFTTTAGEIEHTPSYIKFGFLTAGQGISMSGGSNFNGFVFPKDLNIETNSTREAFVAALKASGIYNGQ